MPSKVLQVRKYLRDDGIAGVDNRRYCAGTSIGGGDEDDGVGRRDSGDVGSGLCGEVDVGSSISPSRHRRSCSRLGLCASIGAMKSGLTKSMNLS